MGNNEETKDEYIIINLFGVNSILFVIYCCMTKYPQIQKLKKTKNYYIVVSVGWKIWCSLAGSLGSLCLIGFDGGIGWGCRHLKGGLSKEGSYSTLTHVVVVSGLCWLLVGDISFFHRCLHSLVQTWQLVSLRAGEPRESKKRHVRQKPQSLCNLILLLTTHHAAFCSLGKSHWVRPHSCGWDYSKL